MLQQFNPNIMNIFKNEIKNPSFDESLLKLNKSYDMVSPFLISSLSKNKIANLEHQKRLCKVIFPAKKHVVKQLTHEKCLIYNAKVK